MSIAGLRRSRVGARESTDPAAEQIRRAVADVRDPVLDQPIGELGMLAAVRPHRGRVDIQLVLPGQAAAELPELRRRLTSAVAAVRPGTRVRLAYRPMPPAQRVHLAERLRSTRAADPLALSRQQVATRVFAVASGKGGVGKSTVSANLAAACALAGQRVGILDADVWGYSIPHLFGVRGAEVRVRGLMMPVQAHGVRLMSTGFFVRDDAPVVWRGPMLHKALEQFLRDVHWGGLDVLFVDLPPGTGDIALSLAELLPDAALLAVTTPQPAAQAVAARVGTMARQMRMPIAGVVENMSTLTCAGCGATTPLFGTGGGARLAAGLGTDLLGQIPLDLAIRESGDRGVPVVVADPASASAQTLRSVAAALPTVRRALAGRPLPLTVRSGQGATRPGPGA